MTNDFSGDESKQSPPPPPTPPTLNPSSSNKHPQLPVDFVVPLPSEELTRQAIVRWPCLVFHSWRLCQRRKRWIRCSAERPLHYPVPYHPSEQIFDGDRGFVLHEVILRERTPHVPHFSLLLYFSLFVSRLQSTPICRYCSYMAKALNITV